MAVISFSNIKSTGGGGATGGTVEDITLWSKEKVIEYVDEATSGKADTTYVDSKMEEAKDYTDSALTEYNPTENFKTINEQSIIGTGDIHIDGEVYHAGTNITIDSENNISTSGVPTTAEMESALDEKQDELVSGTNIKTINGNSVLGSGNIQIDGAIYTGGDHINIDDDNIISTTGLPSTQEMTSAITEAVSTKQDELVSGTNIKTINGISVLGSGNIQIQAEESTYYGGKGIFIDDRNNVSESGLQEKIFSGDTSLYYYKDWEKFDIDFATPTLTVSMYEVSGSSQSPIGSTSAYKNKTSNMRMVEGFTVYVNYFNIAIYVDGATYVVPESTPEPRKWYDMETHIFSDTMPAVSSSKLVRGAPVFIDVDNKRVMFGEWVNDYTFSKTKETLLDFSNIRPDLSNYYTKDETDAEIADATSGKADITYVDSAITSAIAAETARTESTYLKEHQSLANYYTSAQTESAITEAVSGKSDTSYVDQKDVETLASAQTYADGLMAAETARTESTYLKEHQSLDGYATEEWVEDQGYLTEHQDISGKANITYVDSEISRVEGLIPSVEGLASEDYVDEAVEAEKQRSEATYLKEHQSLANYYTKTEVDSEIDGAVSGKADTTAVTQAISSAIASETARTESTYLKEHQSLANYYTKTQTDDAIDGAVSGKTDKTYVDTQDNAVANYVDGRYNAATGYTDSEIAAETARTESVYAKKTEIPSLDGYATETYVDNAVSGKQDTLTAGSGISIDNNVISVTGGTGGLTPEEAQEMIDSAITIETARTESTYLKEHQSLNNYYTKSEVDNEIDTAISAETARTESTYLKEHQDISGKADKSYVDTQDNSLASYVDGRYNAATGYTDSQIAAETARTESVYAKKTEIPSLSGYATETYVTNAVSGKADTTYVNTQLNTKQNKLTAGSGIDITNNVISATGTIPTKIQSANGLKIINADRSYSEQGSAYAGAYKEFSATTGPGFVWTYSEAAGKWMGNTIVHSALGSTYDLSWDGTTWKIQDFIVTGNNGILSTVIDAASVYGLVLNANTSAGQIEGGSESGYLVASTNITHMVKMTQSEYNAATKDPNTFYIIVG